MASFGGRPHPNYSRSIRDLNIIPAQDDQHQDDGYDIAFGLDSFANANFLDADLQGDLNGPSNIDIDLWTNDAAVAENKTVAEPFAYGANTFNQPEPHALPPTSASGPFTQSLTSPTYTTTSPQFGTIKYASPASQASSPFSPGLPSNPNADPAEEAARVAAEEDKRRRNTAASARFRVKKKQREQMLEKSSKELNDRVSSLEGEILQLKQENKWLRGIIIEKKGGEDLEKEYQEFRRTSEEAEEDERSTKGLKKGVGTKVGKA